MGIKERREREKQQMRQEILDAALKLFVDSGYEEVSVRRIAESIEFSPGLLYQYFDNKDHIFEELHSIGFDRFYQRQLQSEVIADPAERLLRHGELYIEFALENPQLYDLMFVMDAPIKHLESPGQWSKGMQSFNYLVSNINDCIKAGYLPNEDPLMLAYLFWSQVHGMITLFTRKRFCPDGMDMKDFFIKALHVNYDKLRKQTKSPRN